MLCLDNSVLSEYLAGTAEARRFLTQYEQEPWVVSSIVLYEALLGCVHGYIDGDPTDVRQAITAAMDVLEVTEDTAAEAAALQSALMERGVPVGHPDALIAANAREHGAAFATADQSFWQEGVSEVLTVRRYETS